ncbi:MAG: collagen-like protein [Alphaproteobacteria bacterium]|nr:collagen-like protein [Alphaproteobacteria bacterium]
MSKIDLGRVVGPRGSKWFIGNSENTFTGDSINDAYLPVNSTILDSDINGKSVLDDIILNKQTGEYYKCVFPGNVSQAKWTYEGSMIGPQGKPGEQGIKGDKGDKGDRGPAFNFDASGHSSDKQNYNNEEVGFAFLDTDNGYIYIKTQDGWSDGFQFRGDKGTSVVSITQLNSQEDAGNNIITFYFDNNTSSSVTIKNGSKG